MAEIPQLPPKIEKTIGKTTYTVTSHFPTTSPTAEQIMQRLINQDLKSKNG